MTAKTPAKVHLRLRFQNLGKPRTAGLCGRAAGACDCGPLSCTKIERPSPLEKPSCKVQLFAQNRSRNYRQKVTATTLFQTASYSDFQLLVQTAHVRFHGRKWVHTRPCSKDRTQRHTRRNRGCFGWGRYYYPRSVPHVSETLRGQMSERQTLPLLGLGRVCSRRTQKAFGTAMRSCASLFRRRRGPAGLRDLFRFCRNRDLYSRRSWFSACARHGWYHYPRTVSHVSETLRGRVSERRTLPLWDLGREVLSKNAESLRDSDALMRVAVPRRRGPAGLRDLFRFCRNCGLYALRSGPFRVCEARGGIATLSALYVLLKRRTAACQNGSFAVF